MLTFGKYASWTLFIVMQFTNLWTKINLYGVTSQIEPLLALMIIIITLTFRKWFGFYLNTTQSNSLTCNNTATLDTTKWTVPLKRVVTRMDTSKSGWTPYVYYTTLYSTPRYTIFRRIYWARELLEKWGNQSKRQLCKEKSWIEGLAPKYSD